MDNNQKFIHKDSKINTPNSIHGNNIECNENNNMYLKKLKNIDLSCKKKFSFFISEIFLKENIKKINIKEIISLFEFCMLSIKEYIKYIMTYVPLIPTKNTFNDYCKIKTSFFKMERIISTDEPSLLLLSCLSSNHDIFILCKIIVYVCENCTNKNEVYKIIGTKLYKHIQETIKDENSVIYSNKINDIIILNNENINEEENNNT